MLERIKGLNETTHGSYRVILVRGKCDFSKLEKETENMSTFLYIYIPGSLSDVKSQYLNGIRTRPISKQCLQDNMIGYTKI
jgi:hypothetical protein